MQRLIRHKSILLESLSWLIKVYYFILPKFQSATRWRRVAAKATTLRKKTSLAQGLKTSIPDPWGCGDCEKL
jgi:hypothetical protein